MPLELILTMQGQFGSCRALRGPLGPQNGLFGPLGLFIWPQSGPKCHIIMFYTCGKCFKVIWGLSWQNTVRSSLYPSWHVIRTKNLNFGTLKNFQWISLPIFFSVHYWPQRVFFVRFYQIWRWCFWEKSTFLHTTHCEVVTGSHSQSRTKLKVVKWGFKKWNQHILMYIYAKQCEILQKNRWKSSNGQNHCFCNGKSAPRCWKHGKLGKLKRKLLKIFKYYTISRVPPCERASPELSENVVLFGCTTF